MFPDHVIGMSPDRNTRKERIFLTGFMGSGKSTVGPILARTLGYDFIDTDAAVERSTGKSINDIFRDDGEQEFRRKERRLVTDLCSRKNIVIACGGGTITDPVGYGLIQMAGITVYLKLSPDQLFARLRTKENRPLLAASGGGRLNDESLHSRVWNLFLLREPYYSRADITVMAGEMEVGPIVDQIVRHLLHYFE